MIATLRVDSLVDTSFYREWISCGKELGLPPPEFHSAMPRERIRLLARPGASSAAIEHFLHLGMRVNALNRSAVHSDVSHPA